MHLFVPVAFLAGSVGPGEVVLLFLVVLVLFGPRRLPDIARQLGKVASELRRAAQNFRDQVMQMDREVPRDHNPPAQLGSSNAPVKPSQLSAGPADPKDHDPAG